MSVRLGRKAKLLVFLRGGPFHKSLYPPVMYIIAFYQSDTSEFSRSNLKSVQVVDTIQEFNSTCINKMIVVEDTCLCI